MLIAKLLELCKKHIKNERLGFSLVKAVDLVIQNDFLDSNLTDNSQYPNEFLTVFLENVKTTRDMSKLNAYVDVFCDMIQFEQDRVRERALSQLMIMLCHQFAIIRKNTAAKLFESLINYPDLFDTSEDNDQCVLLLTDTLWDQMVDKIRPIRNQICDLLKVPKPVLKKPATTSSYATTTGAASTQMGLPT
jgi:ribosome-binding factor A